MTAQSNGRLSPSKVRSSSPVSKKATLSPTSTLSMLADEFGAVVDEAYGKVPAFSRPRHEALPQSAPLPVPLLVLKNFESVVNVVDASSGALTEMNGELSMNENGDMDVVMGTPTTGDEDNDDTETLDGSLDDAALASSMDHHGLERSEKGQWEQALSCWLEAQSVRASLQAAPDENVARSGNNAGVALFQMGRYEDCLYFFERGVQVVENLLSQERQQRQELKKKKKQQQQKQTIPIKKTKEWVNERRRDFGIMLHNLGVALYEMGRNELAMKNLRRAKKVLGSGKNRGDDFSALLAATLYQLGLVCSSEECHPDAWEAFDESWRLLGTNQHHHQNTNGDHRRRRRQKLLRDELDKIEDILASNVDLSFDFS